ncbi:MAG: TIGR00268 family protein, partial [Spartobacteria bacterium]|nr:TIGR00268 family protein [Spartobacteria bacterium]
MTLDEKVLRLTNILKDAAPLVIAYSGGVDSTCLLAMAHQILGSQVLGVIADSPSLPRAALQEALEVANKIGAPVETI